MTSPSNPLRMISKEEFDRFEPARKVVSHDHARRFAILRLPGWRRPVALSWRSDGIEPVLAIGSRSEAWMGIDQRMACVGGDGLILVSLGLASPILDIRCAHSWTAVLCETEVLTFNQDYSVRAILGLPCPACDIVEDEGAPFAVFGDGHRERIG